MPPATASQLKRLLDQLKAEQHAVIDAAAREDGPMHRADLRSISELENAIAAVIALIDERQGT